MTVTDGDVALLARQAVDLLDPTAEIAIEPAGAFDPYRRGEAAWVVWPLVDGRRSFGVNVYGRDGAVDALARILDKLAEDAPYTSRFWGQPFPPCPGHPHPAEVGVAGGDVVLTCPELHTEVGRVHPAMP